jgi:single-strand DNA-binding protein
MSGVNKVILIGNLGADPEVRHTQDGRAIANLRVATSESWRDKATGEKRERTEWHRVVIFAEALAKVAEQYLRKGSKVYLEGQIQTRKWTDDRAGNGAGVEKWTTEVVLQGFGCALRLLDSRGGGGPPAAEAEDYGLDPERAAGPSPNPSPQGGGEQGRDFDDEVPF